MKPRAILILSAALLSACVDWPDVSTPRPTRATVDWPDLVPISSLPLPTGAEAEGTANDRLLARAAALRNRAAVMRRPVPDSDEFERLRARLAR